MAGLLFEAIDELEVGIALCRLDDLMIIESNDTLSLWFNKRLTNTLLTSHFPEDENSRIIKSINKNRKYRFSKDYKINKRDETIQFSTKIVQMLDNNTYLLVRGIINNSDKLVKKMMLDYGSLVEKNKQLLNEEKSKAEAANNAKTLFLASMGHELRTPLHGVLGMSQKLFKTTLDTAQKEYLTTIKNSGDKLLLVMNQVLDFSNIEAGKINLIKEEVDLNKLICEVVNLYKSDFEAKKELEFNVAFNTKNPLIVLSDNIKLKQILVNLINNAIKFTESGSVKVEMLSNSTNQKTYQIELLITDTGIGIDEDFQNEIFKPFIQVDSSTKRYYSGTGLGLSLTKSIIELMDGSISVESKLGEGSCFRVELELPIFNSENQTSELAIEKLKNKNILVVDDSALNREVIKVALEDVESHFFQAENGLQAVEIFKSNRIDIILMDCLMPIMDGFESTKAIRLLEKNSTNVPIIAITASTSTDIDLLCQEAGMNDVMLKPFEFNKLLSKIAFYI